MDNVENTSKSVGLCDDLINDCYEGRVSSPVELTSRVRELKAAVVEDLGRFREAAKMVGDFSAMRKALVVAKANFDAIGANAREGELNLDVVEVICARISAKIEAALASKPRNCDVGTVVEQIARFNSFCDQRSCDKCELPNNGCRLAWAQMPYEAEGEAE